ncbi:hypothetical protein D3C71_19390 [compost metagenome]
MKAIKTQTASDLRRAERQAAKSTVVELAEKRPGLLADRLAQMPILANGLANFDYIVERLIQGGQRDKLERMLDSRSLRIKARRILVEKLLTM